MFETRMKKVAFFIGVLISAWGINTYFLSLSRSGATLAKLSIFKWLGPFATFIIYDPPLYSYISVPALCLMIIAGVSFCFKNVNAAKKTFGSLLLFTWFFVAVLIFEMD
jgi:hypothetical protein